MKEQILALLKERGVITEQIAEIVYILQKPYVANLCLSQCLACVHSVLSKREVQYTLFTGIILDMLAEQNQLPEPLLSVLKRDEPLYGVDETLALGIINLYGTIGLTTFGHLDKTKPGVIGTLDACRHRQRVHTFLDDLVAGIAAAAASKIAHDAAAKDEEMAR